VLLGLVVAAFEGTVVTSAMPTIVRELGGMRAYAWVFSAFLVASTLAVLVCGKLADAFGRRPVFVGGMALFLVGSALCGISTSFTQLVAFRVIQGLGAGAIQPVAMTISADIYTLEERARVQALFNGAWGIANVVGPVMGGWIVMHASWRWVFLVNVPVGVLSAALLVGSYRDPVRVRRQPIGAHGALLAGAAVALASLVIEPGAFGGQLRVALAAVAAASIWALWRHERRTARPILPAAALRHPAVRSGLVAGAFVGAILYACAAYIPLWMSAHGTRSALDSGLALMPLLVGWAFGSSFGVKVLVRRGMRASVGAALPSPSRAPRGSPSRWRSDSRWSSPSRRWPCSVSAPAPPRAARSSPPRAASPGSIAARSRARCTRRACSAARWRSPRWGRSAPTRPTWPPRASSRSP
jgi:MFS family permease